MQMDRLGGPTNTWTVEGPASVPPSILEDHPSSSIFGYPEPKYRTAAYTRFLHLLCQDIVIAAWREGSLLLMLSWSKTEVGVA